MSWDPSDAYFEAMAEEEQERDLEEFRESLLEEFQEHLLSAYYLAHREIPQKALGLLNEARMTRAVSSAATLALASSSIELSVREVVLRPLVHGVIHQDAVADAVVGLVLGHSAFERFKDLLFGILAQVAGIDLRTYTRPGRSELLWSEIRDLRDKRNLILHHGESASPEHAARAVEVAEHVWREVLGRTLGKFGFTVDPNGTIQPPPPKVTLGPVV